MYTDHGLSRKLRCAVTWTRLFGCRSHERSCQKVRNGGRVRAIRSFPLRGLSSRSLLAGAASRAVGAPPERAAPRCQTLRVQPFWVEQDERIVATATAVIDAQYNQRWKETLGHLVSFEALPDCGVAVDRLLGHVVEYFEGQDCVAIRASFLAGWQLPLTIDGYNALASAFHTYNPPYYHSYLKNSGFETEKGMVEYQLRLTPQLARSHRELVVQGEA